MKKFYTLLLLALLTTVASKAAVLTFNVNIDNAVCLEYYAGTFQLNKGTNEI